MKMLENFCMQHEMLTQVGRGLINLYYCLGNRKETDLPQHARSVELSPSALNLWETTDSMAPNKTLRVQVRSQPTSYQKNPKCQTKSL